MQTQAITTAAAVPHTGAYVHVRVGACDIAVPIDQVREALPFPPQGLTVLPRRQDGLLGVVHAAGVAVPVVALERWLPIAVRDDEAAQKLLVLQQNGALLGVRVDAVLGVKTMAADAARQIHHTADDNELFESVLPGNDASPTLCILEVARLMRLSQVWCASAEVPPAAGAPARVATHQPVHGGLLQRCGLFHIGSELWAVPVRHVEHVVAVPEIELVLHRSDRSWAVCQWQKRKLPLVDISTGRQASNRQDAPWMVLLSLGPLALGLSVTACRQFVDLPQSVVASTPGDALQAGVAVLPELGKVHVLDVAKLFQCIPEVEISRYIKPADTAASTSADAADPSPYMVFEADQRYASPVAGILGVVELTQQAKDDLSAGRRAAMAWRGTTINIVNLPAIGKPGDSIDAQLAVLVQSPHDQAPPLGIAIKRLSDWLPAHSARRSGMRMGTMGELSLINAPSVSGNASLVVVELAQMAYLLG